jgi:hypothetical protein
MTDISGFTFTNCGFVSFTKSANATTGSFTLTRGVNCNFNNVLLGGGRAFMTTCTDVLMSNTIYYDHPAITTTTSNAMNAFDVGTACVRCVFDGLSFGGLKLVQPYLGILNIGAAGCTDIKLRNLGTYISPLDMGGDYVDCTWTRTTTVMTITKVSHGLKTNDLIAMNIISDVTPKAVTTTSATLWTVASAPTSDTFTVTVTNAGTTSGSGSYYPVMTGTLVTLAGSAAAVNVKVQRCYTPHLRTGLTSMDNSSKNLTYESVFGTEWGVQLLPGLNTYMKMIQSTPALTAQTSCYGTHWLDYFTTAVSVNFSGVSWTRTTTVATVTSVGHGLRTGDLINVTTTSDASAIVKGQKTITAATSDTFRFTCLNAGSASGTLTFKQLNGRIAILMNESTSDTASLINLSGGAAFTSTGGLFMPIVNQYAIFETPYYLLGHLNFPIAVVVMGGGTIGNYDITYSLDFGSGYSSFKNLYYPRPGGGGSNGSTNVTMTSTVGVSVGDYVFGTNIAPNAKVVSITNSTTIVVDIANIGTVSGVLTFNQLPNESDITSSGVKMKVKILTSTTNSTAITSLFLYTYSDLVSRSYQYDLDVVNITVTGLKDNTEVRIYLTGTTTEVGGIETATSGTTDNRYYTSSLTVGLVVDIAIINVTYENERITGYVIPSLDSSIPIQQRFDRNYNNTI